MSNARSLASIARSGTPAVAKAWVSFDGTKDTTGAVSTANTNRQIRASFNVTSVLRNGAGDFTITFTTAMPDANFAVLATTRGSVTNDADDVISVHPTTDPTTTTVRIINHNASLGAQRDVSYISLAIYD
jgi:hypothetical protein